MRLVRSWVGAGLIRLIEIMVLLKHPCLLFPLQLADPFAKQSRTVRLISATVRLVERFVIINLAVTPAGLKSQRPIANTIGITLHRQPPAMLRTYARPVQTTLAQSERPVRSNHPHRHSTRGGVCNSLNYSSPSYKWSATEFPYAKLKCLHCTSVHLFFSLHQHPTLVTAFGMEILIS